MWKVINVDGQSITGSQQINNHSSYGDFKNSNSSSLDGISSFFLRLAMPVVTNSLCTLFNTLLSKSIEHQVFPDNWKIARIAPIYKRDIHLGNKEYTGLIFLELEKLSIPLVMKSYLKNSITIVLGDLNFLVKSYLNNRRQCC